MDRLRKNSVKEPYGNGGRFYPRGQHGHVMALCRGGRGAAGARISPGDGALRLSEEGREADGSDPVDGGARRAVAGGAYRVPPRRACRLAARAFRAQAGREADGHQGTRFAGEGRGPRRDADDPGEGHQRNELPSTAEEVV